jgi:hypothetical protein
MMESDEDEIPGANEIDALSDLSGSEEMGNQE